MRIAQNIPALAEKNSALLKKIGFDPQKDDPFALDSREVFQSTGLFSEHAIDQIFSTESSHTFAPAHQQREQFSPALGMVLIRPDMVQISPRVEAFLGSRFRLLDVTTTTVTPDSYWKMYGDAITGREMYQSRLTRAAVYINSPCRLMIFDQPGADAESIPTADYVVSTLKGRQGVAQKGTLRGELVYRGAIEAGLHTLDDPQTALAADPFGAYRKIVAERHAGPHAKLEYPLLFFAGVGIHIPDYQEMQRDLPLLAKNNLQNV